MHIKILSLDDLAKKIKQFKSEGKIVGLSHGVFDLLHPGHIFHFESAKKICDVLIVTITQDQFVRKGPGRPAFNEKLRMHTLANIENIDYVGLSQWPSAVELIQVLQPNLYIKGSDYKCASDDVTGNIMHEVQAVRDAGGDFAYTDEETFSSSTLINNFFNNHSNQVSEYLSEFKKNHCASDIIQMLKDVKSLRVTVVGEAILDRYDYCHAMGKPPKDPIISARYALREDFAGGSVAIARHLANFCDQVNLVSYVGEGNESEFFNSVLQPNINFHPIVTPDRPTVCKQRFLDPEFLGKMFEMQYLDDHDLPDFVQDNIIETIKQLAEESDMIVISDFGHGLFSKRIQDALYDTKCFLALNVQSNSANMGYNPVTKYKNANFVSIDEPELRFAAHSKYDHIHNIAHGVKSKLNTNHLLVSQGPGGCIIYSDDQSPIHTPVFSQRIVDRTGAGDALFSITSPCMAKEYDPRIIGFIANCVGAMAVETVCNRDPIDPIILYKFITYLLK